MAAKSAVTRLHLHRRFHTVKKYGLPGDNRLHYGRIPFVHKYDRSYFLALLVSEYKLRMSMQKRERLERNMNIRYPPPGYDGRPQVPKSDENGLQTIQHELNDANYHQSQRSRKLWEIEVMLPRKVKQNYKSIRQDPKWYMRKELVKDCAEQGGCCRRSCGCCALRAKRSSENGVGHCTVECACCVDYRGFDPCPEEKAAIIKGMTMNFRCDIATYFLKMVNAFFSKP